LIVATQDTKIKTVGKSMRRSAFGKMRQTQGKEFGLVTSF